MKICLLFFVLIIFPPSKFNEWKMLENAEYSITYPDNWTLDQSGIAGTKFMLFGTAVQGQSFRNNINLIVQDLGGQGINLEKFVELSESQIKQFITAAEIHRSETKNAKHTIVYSGSQGQLNLKWEQYYWVRNDKAYILTFTADLHSFESGIEMAHQIMDSFVIKTK